MVSVRSLNRHSRVLVLKKLFLLLLLLLLIFFLLFISHRRFNYAKPELMILSALPFPKEAGPTKSGYIPIVTSSSSSAMSMMFYAFYEAESPETPIAETPIIVWLQGGPGCSSMYGNFLEMGPWRLAGDFLRRNPGSWNRLFGLLFLDNPIGSGFSTATSLPSDQLSVAKHLYAALSKFLDSAASSFRSRPIFLAGESYAGKYVPAAAHYFLRKNAEHDRRRRVNLGGVAIGNGLVEAATQVATHASTAFYSGLINERQRRELEGLQAEAARLAESRQWADAADARYKVMHALGDMTGLATLFDFTKAREYPIAATTAYLNEKTVKEGIGAGGEAEGFERCSNAVEAALHGDTMKSVKPSVEFLLGEGGVRVLVYEGLHDLWDGVASTDAWLKTMSWDGTKDFLESTRTVWRDGEGVLAGYVQRFQNLTNVVVFGAGHLVPVDQPVNTRFMIENWVLARGMFV